MRVERGKLEGDVRITDDFTLHGMITGSATVTTGGRLVLHGMVCRDLILESGAEVDLHGMVCCNVYNQGGDLRVYGMIVGSLHKEAGTTIVNPKAVVQDRVV